MQTDSLFESVNPQELSWHYSTVLSIWDNPEIDIETIASMECKGGPRIMASAAPPPMFEDRRPDRKYWEAAKKEMFLLLCTQDTKYSDLREKLKKAQGKGTVAIMTLLAGTIAGVIGVAVELIIGFLSICVYAVIKFGKETYCTVQRSRQQA